MKNLQLKKTFLILGGATLILVLGGYGGYRYWDLNEVWKSLEAKVAELEQSLAAAENNLSRAEKENVDLAGILSAEQSKNSLFEAQIRDLGGVVGEISGTVGVLEKLRKTDPELLRKYSRVYFLSENYLPRELVVIDSQYIYNKDKPQQIHIFAWPFLQDLLEAARRDGHTLHIVSAYRAFGTQSSLKSSYRFTYGAGTANQFSADQGYSEHQLGTTVDFTSPELDDVFLNFQTTKAYQWLVGNAYRFGFILSYPDGNLYYRFEPWHWRFVGVAFATKLHNEGKRFYELSQREIDEYLVNIFD